MRRFLLYLGLLAAGCAGAWIGVGRALAAADPPEIDPATLRADVERLADDALEGRATGEPGGDRAAALLARAMREIGLSTLDGASDHRATFDLYRYGWDESDTTLRVWDDGPAAVVGQDFRPFDFSREGVVDARVVFAGYGISAPRLGWDDYDRLDVAGKIVLVLRHVPQEDEEENLFLTDVSEPATFLTKAAVAAQHGARALFVVTDPLHHGEPESLRLEGRLSLQATAEDDASPDEDLPELLAAQISQPFAERLLGLDHPAFVELQRAVDDRRPVSHRELRQPRVRLRTRLRSPPPRFEAANVVGALRGQHPALRDEWVVIGAHYDHVGRLDGDGDTVFNGADDNASGTAGLIALARALVAGPPPARSIAFVAFAAEEHGLLGSRAFLRDAQLPPANIRFMLNLDMIGRLNGQPLWIGLDQEDDALHRLVQQAASERSLEIRRDDESGAPNSDHYPFHRRKIPFLFLFSGLHDDYHGLADHADKIDYGGLEKILGLAHQVVETVANEPTPFGGGDRVASSDAPVSRSAAAPGESAAAAP